MLLSIRKEAMLMAFLLIGNVLFAQQNFSQTGDASFYADKFEGRKTANGEIYRHHKMTAAHRTLPFGTQLKVTNLRNGKSIVVTVNDRGPFVKGRIIDLSKGAAGKLDYIRDGVTKVKIESLGGKSSGGSPSKSIEQQTAPNHYYQIETSEIPLQGYGVQVGSFNQMANLIRLSNQVKELIGGKCYVKVAYMNGMAYNRLIVGVENDKQGAERHMKKLQKVFRDCFVIQL